MTSNRPYLLRAFYDWIVDNQCTPHIVVDAEFPAVEVPRQFVQQGQIVLNVSPSAAANFLMDNDALSFNARFSGQPMQVYVPIGAVLAIYARENGEGTIFSEPEHPQDDMLSEDDDQTQAEEREESVEATSTDKETPEKAKKTSHLRVIK
ncbi:stringent starvation protein B [Pseudoalteromonas rubra]|uniref:Stringent starvation protein B n=1 Tax=Pseudoalteromonas rubra TaxID=43658 RepID=A0A8T0CD24_9GAMM|nr:ClpXP protease specificity-enhancing factor [Pseudoalteromonas rubra]KAF7788606.1 stringent starvation protein B [Pseudoalteromonas rubra]